MIGLQGKIKETLCTKGFEAKENQRKGREEKKEKRKQVERWDTWIHIKRKGKKGGGKELGKKEGCNCPWTSVR